MVTAGFIVCVDFEPDDELHARFRTVHGQLFPRIRRGSGLRNRVPHRKDGRGGQDTDTRWYMHKIEVLWIRASIRRGGGADA